MAAPRFKTMFKRVTRKLLKEVDDKVGQSINNLTKKVLGSNSVKIRRV